MSGLSTRTSEPHTTTRKPKAHKPLKRYGFLGLKHYNPETHVLIRPQSITLEFPAYTDLDKARNELIEKVGYKAVDWLVTPRASEWECGCSGDASSGFLPCGFHCNPDNFDEPSNGVTAYGVWLPVPRNYLPVRAKARGEYPVPRKLVPAGHPAIVLSKEMTLAKKEAASYGWHWNPEVRSRLMALAEWLFIDHRHPRPSVTSSYVAGFPGLYSMYAATTSDVQAVEDLQVLVKRGICQEVAVRGDVPSYKLVEIDAWTQEQRDAFRLWQRTRPS